MTPEKWMMFYVLILVGAASYIMEVHIQNMERHYREQTAFYNERRKSFGSILSFHPALGQDKISRTILYSTNKNLLYYISVSTPINVKPADFVMFFPGYVKIRRYDGKEEYYPLEKANK